MKNNIRYTPLFLALLLISCGVARPAPVQTDSTRVEVRTHVVHQIDTAYVELPVIVEKVATLDTASFLENIYAKSEAIVSGGVLHHSLATKPVRQPVEVKTEIVYRDSLVYRDRVSTERVEVEKPLNWWKQTRMILGTIVLLALFAVIIFKIIVFIVSLNLKKS